MSTITSNSNWLGPIKSIIPKVLLHLTNWSSQVCVHESALSIWNSTKYAKRHKSQLLSKSKAQCPKIKRLSSELSKATHFLSFNFFPQVIVGIWQDKSKCYNSFGNDFSLRGPIFWVFLKPSLVSRHCALKSGTLQVYCPVLVKSN